MPAGSLAMKESNRSFWRLACESPFGHLRVGRCARTNPVGRPRRRLGGDWQEDPGDEEILARAHSEGRVLITLDKDFGELAIVHGVPHSGILRLVLFPAKQQGSVVVWILARYGGELASGAILTADSDRIGIRPPYNERSPD